MQLVGATLVKLIATATSGLVSFTTNVIRPVKVTCEFSPMQEGTGNPSPDNVRPIIGWTGCEITHTHGNLIDSSKSILGYYINSAGQETESISADVRALNASDYFHVVPGRSYTMRMEYIDAQGGGNDVVFCWYTADKTFIGRGTLTKKSDQPYYTLTQVAPSNAYYGRVNYFTSNRATALVYDSTDLDAVPDSEISVISITFTNPSTGNPLTVYGGTVTLNEDGSADLVVNRIYYNANIITNFTTDYPKVFDNYIQFRGGLASVVTTGSANKSICNILKYSTSGVNSFSFTYNLSGTYKQISILAPRTAETEAIKTVAQLRSYYNNLGIEFVIPRVSPTRYHFPNVGQLKAFLGTNNVWHDMNGDITVEYWKKQ